MRFELDKLLIDEILFFMENQDGDFRLDTQKGQIVDFNNIDFKHQLEDEPDEESDFENDDRYISLPEWGSQDGYRMMEHFAAGLKSPVARHELSLALNNNKGVFRAFKNVIVQYPEIEKMWFKYKENEMKNEVIAWYNSLRETWGLEPVGSEPEDTSSLVLEDFVLREGESDFSFIAETSDKEYAGAINASLNDSILKINNLEVNPEYRGLGLGKTLLAKLLEKADEKKLTVTIDLPSQSDFFSRSLHLEEFKPCMRRFIREKTEENWQLLH
ncbi:MAG: UPF0158 family protein [Treponema sp.]|nr:UPF0158 family protein [Treponema sp.]